MFDYSVTQGPPLWNSFVVLGLGEEFKVSNYEKFSGGSGMFDYSVTPGPSFCHSVSELWILT